MGRKRKSRLDLPERVYFVDGRYRFMPKGMQAIELGTDHGAAMAKWGKLVDLGARPAHTLGQWGDMYMVEVAAKKAPATYRGNVREWKNLRPAFGHLLPGEITQQLMYKYMAARGAIVRANREKALLSHMLSYCVLKGAIAVNPLYGMRRDLIGHSEFPRDRLVTDKELEIFLRPAGPVLAAYIDIKERTGMRQGDILSLRIEDLTDEGIAVTPRKSRRRHPRTGAAAGKRRLYTWDPGLRATVDRLLAAKALHARQRSTPWLFTTRLGKSYYQPDKASAPAFRSLWETCMRKAAALAAAEGWVLQPFTEHDLRARTGTAAERAGRAGHQLLGNSEATFQRAYNRGVEVVTPLDRGKA